MKNRKRLWKRTLACLLLLALVLSSLPVGSVPADAAEGLARVNMIGTLAKTFGCDLQTAETLLWLVEENIVDADGRLGADWTAQMEDGREMNAAALLQYALKDGVDLGQSVTVGGRTLTLAEIRRLAAMEGQLALLNEILTQEADFTMTEEHHLNLMNLQQQIATSGLELVTRAGLSTGAVDQSVRLTVKAPTTEFILSGEDQFFEFTVALPDGFAHDYDVTFSYQIMEGSARQGTHYSAASYGETVTLNRATPNRTVTVTIAPQNNNGSGADSRWSGDKAFFVRLYNPVNALFTGDKQAENIQVKLRNNFIYQFAWSETAIYDTNGSDGHTIYLSRNMNDIAAALQKTMDDIYGEEGTAHFKTAMTVQMRDLGNTNPPAGQPALFRYTFGGLPLVYDFNGSKMAVTWENPPATNTSVSLMIGSAGWSNSNFNFNFKASGNALPHYILLGNVTSQDPEAPILSRLHIRTTSLSLGLMDNTTPQVAGISLPADAVFYPGDHIPITVTFTEPVTITADIRLAVATRSLKPVEAADSKGNRLTFLYEVQSVDNTGIRPLSLKSPAGISGLITGVNASNNITAATIEFGDSYIFDNVMESARLQDLVQGIAVALPAYTPDAKEALIEVSLFWDDALDTELLRALETVYGNDALKVDEDGLPAFYSKALYLMINGQPINLTYDEDEQNSKTLTGIFPFPALSTNEESYIAELYILQKPADKLPTGGGIPLIGQAVSFSRQGVTAPDPESIHITYPEPWPSGEADIIYTTADTPTVLSYQAPPGILGSFLWSSLDETVATIDASTGEIAPVGAGQTAFRLIWSVDPAVFVTSRPLTVKDGGRPAIVAPGDMGLTTIRLGDEAVVRWGTNITGYNMVLAQPTVYLFELYKGRFGSEAEISGVDRLAGGDNTLNIPAEGPPVTRFVIPAACLDSIGEYTVRISTTNPYQPAETVSALLYINVIARPAVTRIADLAQYHLDSEAITITWTLENIDLPQNDPEALFSIHKNSDPTPLHSIALAEMEDLGAGAYRGTYTLNAAVDGDALMDKYIITLTAMNRTDEARAGASRQIYVYNDGALSLLIDGLKAGGRHLMSNRPWAQAEDFSQYAGAGLQELRASVNLHNFISINHSEYEWNWLRDMIAWNYETLSGEDDQVTTRDVLTLNHKQGDIYEDIELFTNISTYAPSVELMLSGLRDGLGRVTATHAATGMSESVEVEVETLGKVLYMFQFSPAAPTTLYYTDGKGFSRQVTTHDDGSLVLYEPNGIGSNISLMSTLNGSVYLGTLYRSSLASGERDWAALQLYPLNSLRLKEAAKATLYLKDENGNPYRNKSVTLRGGVYKNMTAAEKADGTWEHLGYCQDMLFNINGLTNQQAKNLIPAEVTTDYNGAVTVYMAPDRLWAADSGDTADTPLAYTDQLTFVFELTFGADASTNYYPKLVSLNGNLNFKETVALGEHLVRLEAVADKNRSKPFVAWQASDYHLPNGAMQSALGYTGYIGPGSSFPEVDLHSRVMLWGTNAAEIHRDYSVSLRDQFNVRPAQQTSRAYVYQFASIPIVENVLMMTGEKAPAGGNLWWDTGHDFKSRKITLELYEPGFKHLTVMPVLQTTLEMPWKIIDMSFVEKVNESSHVQSVLTTLDIHYNLQGVNDFLGVDTLNSTLGNIAEYGVKTLLTTDINANIAVAKFNAVIRPTADPTVFTAYVFAGILDGIDGPEFSEKESGMYFEHDNIVSGALGGLGIMGDDSLEHAKALPVVDGIKLAFNGASKIADNLTHGPPHPSFKELWNKATSDQSFKGLSSTSVVPLGHLSGYYEAQIQYNFDEAKWEIYTLNGGFEVGFSVTASYTHNTAVGPVPVNFHVKGMGFVELIFNTAVRYGEIAVPARRNTYGTEYNGTQWQDNPIAAKHDYFTWDESITGDKVNDYLTAFRLNGYVRVFGGIGFDQHVFAAKIGAFGRLDLDFMTQFLSRTYIDDSEPLLASERQLNGQYLEFSGTIGLSAKGVIFGLGAEVTIVDATVGGVWKYNDWEYIRDYWERAPSSPAHNNPIINNPMSPFAVNLADPGLMVISSALTTEKRDYLEQAPRVWQGKNAGTITPFAIDPVANLPQSLQTNAYPFAGPLLSEDGKLLLYLADGNSSDVSAMAVYAAKSDAMGNFSDAGAALPLPADAANYPSHGVSGLALAGDINHAVAVWVRQGTDLGKGAGEAVSLDEQVMMANGSEIMAAIYKGGTWSTTPLTANTVPDFAPVVATNGEKTIVAWRSSYSAEAEDYLDFRYNTAYYRIHDGGAWSEAKILYNGTDGDLGTLAAAMLEDGTAAVAYAVNMEDQMSPAPDASLGQEGTEICYTVIGDDGEIRRTIQATNNLGADGAPQLTTALFTQQSGPAAELFVLGWVSLDAQHGEHDIRLIAFDEEAFPSEHFNLSFADIITAGQAEIGASFGFARRVGAQEIGNLSLLWTEPGEGEGTGQGTQASFAGDILKAVRVVEQKGRFGLSHPLVVAEMGDGVIIDMFDAYTAGGDTLNAVILGTEYQSVNPADPTSYDYVLDARSGAKLSAPLEGEEEAYNIFVPRAVTNMYTAGEAYGNSIQIAALSVDYANLLPQTPTQIALQVENTGYLPITALTLAADGVSTELSGWPPGFVLMPNESVTVSFSHQIGTRIEDVDYEVSAQFVGAGQAYAAGTAYLAVADIGIAGARVVSEQDGKRVFEVMLYNESNVPLAGSGGQVRLGVYEDNSRANLMPHIEGQGTEAFIIDDDADLALIDAGAYSLTLNYDIDAYVQEGLAEKSEIPSAGIWLYFGVWLEDAQGDMLAEYIVGNNEGSITFKSLLNDRQSPVRIMTELDNSNAAGTLLEVALQNNSLVSVQNGNVIASLLDEKGLVLEQLQSYDPLTGGGFVSLGEEQIVNTQFQFGQTGTRYLVEFSDAVLDDNSNTGLSNVVFDGYVFTKDDFYPDGANARLYHGGIAGFSGDLTYRLIVEDPRAAVAAYLEEKLVAEGQVGTIAIPTGGGDYTIRFEVTAADGVTKDVYLLTLATGENDRPGGGSGGGQTVRTIPAAEGKVHVSYTLSDGNVLLSPTESQVREIIAASVDMVVFDLKGVTGAHTTTLPQTAAAAFEAAGLGLEIRLPQGTLRLDTEALSAAVAGAGSEGISLTIRQIALSALNAAQQTALGSEDVVYEILLRSGGKNVTDYEGGLTAIVPYSDALPAAVWHLDGDGEKEKVSGTYLSADQAFRFELPHLSLYVVGPEEASGLPFSDVLAADWFYEDVRYVYENGLFNGTSATLFSPQMPMSRAMLVTVLYRMEGQPSVAGLSNPFDDVEDGKWYTNAVIWAAANGIVKGNGNGLFGTNDSITRQDLAAMLLRYAQWADNELPQTLPARDFADANEISDYAKDAVMDLYRAEVIEGKGDGVFDPRGSATRAEVAAMLHRFAEAITN